MLYFTFFYTTEDNFARFFVVYHLIRLTIKDHLKASNGVLEGYQFSIGAREHLGHLERLTEESLDLTSTSDRQLVVLRQLVHAQNSNDVL